MMSTNRQIDLDQAGKKRISPRRAIWGAAFFLLLVSAGILLAKFDLLRTLSSPVSFVVELVAPTALKETDGRINALILGLDSREGTGLLNTDTILVGSLSATGADPAIVSIPRDLWLNLAPYGQGRINAAYSAGGTKADGKFDEARGVEFAKRKVEETLGVPLHYWAVIDFEGFKEIIETLGGVEVCVERTFDDFSYPVAGKESAPVPQRYEHLHFDAGCQLMGGGIALKYARSRLGTNGEGNDFARVRRQQKVILGVRDKILSLNLLLDSGKIVKLWEQVAKSIQTNMTLGELKRALEITQKFADLGQVKSLVLDPDSKLVYHPSNSAPYGGAYVLVPAGGNFEAIHASVRKLFFEGMGAAENQ